MSLKPFYISVTEITNAQYGRFLKATGHPAPLYWEDKNLNGPNQPVVGVTWHDAAAFCRWLTKVTGVPHELPTEDQWEAAARGGLVGQPYPWGDQAPDAGGVFRANFRNDRSPERRVSASPRPVGSFPANGYGLFDMAGNVSEWCQDRYVPLRHRRPVQARGLTPPQGRLLDRGPGTCAPPPASPPRPSMPMAISASGWCVCPNPDPIFFYTFVPFYLAVIMWRARSGGPCPSYILSLYFIVLD